MSKIKITELKCFEQVAEVIGPKNAERELFIASQSPDSDFEDSKSLCQAFIWKETRQGDDFWVSVLFEDNPYEVNYDD